MSARILSLLLIAAVLVCQLARSPHAHPGMGAAEQSEHDRTPHVHLLGFSHAHGHSHSGDHDPGDKSDQSEEPRCSAVGSSHDPLTLTLAVDLSPATVKGNSIEWEQSDLPALFTDIGAEREQPTGSVHFVYAADSLVFDGSNTYLTLRQLRI